MRIASLCPSDSHLPRSATGLSRCLRLLTCRTNGDETKEKKKSLSAVHFWTNSNEDDKGTKREKSIKPKSLDSIKLLSLTELMRS